jgi:hypothetical protein
MIGLAVLLPLAGMASAQRASAPTTLRVEPPFTDEKSKPATNLSGMACAPPVADGGRLCLAVDDEGSHAQWVEMAGDRLIPGGKVTLAPVPRTATAATSTRCPGGVAPAGKRDVDGEAVAYAAPYWYVIGSHGCARKKRTFSPPAFMVYRVIARAQSSEAASSAVAAALREIRPVSDYAERALDANGVTIEGLAVSGGRLIVGLRAPVAGAAYILEVDLSGAFGGSRKPASPRLVRTALGADAGIRDMATLPDGRLLVLAGAAQEQTIPYSLHLVVPATGHAIPVPGWSRAGGTDAAKAEGLVVLEADAHRAKVVVLYDGPANGGPELASVELPSAAAPNRRAD